LFLVPKSKCITGSTAPNDKGERIPIRLGDEIGISWFGDRDNFRYILSRQRSCFIKILFHGRTPANKGRLIALTGKWVDGKTHQAPDIKRWLAEKTCLEIGKGLGFEKVAKLLPSHIPFSPQDDIFRMRRYVKSVAEAWIGFGKQHPVEFHMLYLNQFTMDESKERVFCSNSHLEMEAREVDLVLVPKNFEKRELLDRFIRSDLADPNQHPTMESRANHFWRFGNVSEPVYGATRLESSCKQKRSFPSLFRRSFTDAQIFLTSVATLNKHGKEDFVFHNWKWVKGVGESPHPEIPNKEQNKAFTKVMKKWAAPPMSPMQSPTSASTSTGSSPTASLSPRASSIPKPSMDRQLSLGGHEILQSLQERDGIIPKPSLGRQLSLGGLAGLICQGADDLLLHMKPSSSRKRFHGDSAMAARSTSSSGEDHRTGVQSPPLLSRTSSRENSSSSIEDKVLEKVSSVMPAPGPSSSPKAAPANVITLEPVEEGEYSSDDDEETESLDKGSEKVVQSPSDATQLAASVEQSRDLPQRSESTVKSKDATATAEPESMVEQSGSIEESSGEYFSCNDEDGERSNNVPNRVVQFVEKRSLRSETAEVEQSVELTQQSNPLEQQSETTADSESTKHPGTMEQSEGENSSDDDEDVKSSNKVDQSGEKGSLRLETTRVTASANQSETTERSKDAEPDSMEQELLGHPDFLEQSHTLNQLGTLEQSEPVGLHDPMEQSDDVVQRGTVEESLESAEQPRSSTPSLAITNQHLCRYTTKVNITRDESQACAPALKQHYSRMGAIALGDVVESDLIPPSAPMAEKDLEWERPPPPPRREDVNLYDCHICDLIFNCAKERDLHNIVTHVRPMVNGGVLPVGRLRIMTMDRTVMAERGPDMRRFDPNPDPNPPPGAEPLNPELMRLPWEMNKEESGQVAKQAESSEESMESEAVGEKQDVEQSELAKLDENAPVTKAGKYGSAPTQVITVGEAEACLEHMEVSGVESDVDQKVCEEQDVTQSQLAELVDENAPVTKAEECGSTPTKVKEVGEVEACQEHMEGSGVVSNTGEESDVDPKAETESEDDSAVAKGEASESQSQVIARESAVKSENIQTVPGDKIESTAATATDLTAQKLIKPPDKSRTEQNLLLRCRECNPHSYFLASLASSGKPEWPEYKLHFEQFNHSSANRMHRSEIVPPCAVVTKNLTPEDIEYLNRKLKEKTAKEK
jgi:hypothetical protein